MTARRSLTCLVADDHPAIVTAVADFLESSGLRVLAVPGDGRRAVAAARAAQPDLAIVDYRMPRLGGAELLRALKEASPSTRLAVYTADASEELLSEAQEAGAEALVLKEAPLADLLRALDCILAGRSYVDPAFSRGTLDGDSGRGSHLSPRENDVLSLLTAGLSYQEIGRRLGVGEDTVRTHVRRACKRLGAKTRTEAIATAIRRGLIS